MRQLGLTILGVLTTLINVNGQTTVRGYCDSNWCKLPKEHEAHFDPYYNGHLCENFDPEQTDFSKEYLELRTRHRGENTLQHLVGYDLSAIWMTVDNQQNGVIGLDCKRIRIFITKVTRDAKDNLMYRVTGKSNVNGNICDFSGQIKLLKAFASTPGEESEHEHSGNLFAEYNFNEDKTQKGVGSFTGVFECFYYLDKKNRKGFLDKSSDIADGYFNRTYVGTWTSFSTKAVKKCIWGDYRLPFTFDFDCGDGEMHVCDKYVQNGWTTFNGGAEYDFVNDKAVLKDKWWLK
jgi:hypothetical protein